MSESSPALSPEVDQGQPCELRQAQFGLFLLRLLQADWWGIQGYVADRVGSAPGLLEEAAVVLDIDALTQLPSPEEAADLLDRLRAAGLRPMAIAADPGEQARELARLFGLPSVPRERGRRRQARVEVVAELDSDDHVAPNEPAVGKEVAPAPEPEPEAAAVEPTSTARATPTSSTPATETTGPMIVSQPVRSGQQLYARGRDLIVTAAVSAGAEVIADGNIHVYGRLAGKALAGARGDEQARIYCLDFQPELVSVAGHYRLLESIPESSRGRAVQVVLDGEKLDIRPLNRSAGA
ncbi:MAG: septum site-determining protein MinC [Xanthomonadales bacterium]|nr:septum site-determining protein MinC [Xanthomonadales bacterium]